MKWNERPPVDFPNETLWKGKKRETWEFFCPYCKLKRRLPYRPQPGGVRQILQVAVTSAFIMVVSWPWFEWKGIVTFVPLWAIYEGFYRSRMRAAVNCSNCGFDPFLYLTDVQKARIEVERRARERFAEKGIPFPGTVTPTPGTGTQKSQPTLASADPKSIVKTPTGANLSRPTDGSSSDRSR